MTTRPHSKISQRHHFAGVILEGPVLERVPPLQVSATPARLIANNGATATWAISTQWVIGGLPKRYVPMPVNAR